MSYIVEYLKNDTIKYSEHLTLSESFQFCKQNIYNKIPVYSLIKREPNKNDVLYINYFYKENQITNVLSFTEFSLLINGSTIDKKDFRIKHKREDIFEILYPNNKLIRFPSCHDFFAYIYKTKSYNFHVFYHLDNNTSNKSQYIDDNFILYNSPEDKFYILNMEEKIDNKFYNNLQQIPKEEKINEISYNS